MKKLFFIIIIFIFFFNFPNNSISQDIESTGLIKISQDFFHWSYKIACLIVGYLFAKLGYNLLLKGISGDFKFKAQFKGATADLISASPGLFFILLACIIISFTIYRGLELHFSKTIVGNNSSISSDPNNKGIALPVNPKF